MIAEILARLFHGFVRILEGVFEEGKDAPVSRKDDYHEKRFPVLAFASSDADRLQR